MGPLPCCACGDLYTHGPSEPHGKIMDEARNAKGIALFAHVNVFCFLSKRQKIDRNCERLDKIGNEPRLTAAPETPEMIDFHWDMANFMLVFHVFQELRTTICSKHIIK